MKKILLILTLFISMAAKAQDKVLRIPYSSGKSIYGIISEPSNDGQKHGVAIISHGFNGTHHFGRDYFKTLNDLGYAVYTFDFPCGSVNSQSLAKNWTGCLSLMMQAANTNGHKQNSRYHGQTVFKPFSKDNR